MKQEFSISEAIKFGWQVTKENLGFLLLLGLIQLAISFTIREIGTSGVLRMPLLSRLIFNLAYFGFQVLIWMGMTKIGLKLSRGKKGEFFDLFSCYPLLIKGAMGTILYFLIVLGGWILFIIPAFIWLIKYGFFMYFIVDKGVGPVQALKESARITSGNKMELFVFYLVEMGIMLLGVLALVVGIFVAMPVISIAQAFIYQKLLAQPEEKEKIGVSQGQSIDASA